MQSIRDYLNKSKNPPGSYKHVPLASNDFVGEEDHVIRSDARVVATAFVVEQFQRSMAVDDSFHQFERIYHHCLLRYRLSLIAGVKVILLITAMALSVRPAGNPLTT